MGGVNRKDEEGKYAVLSETRESEWTGRRLVPGNNAEMEARGRGGGKI